MLNYATDSKLPTCIEQGPRIEGSGNARYKVTCKCCKTEREVFSAHLKSYTCTVCQWGRDAKPIKGAILAGDKDLFHFKSLAEVTKDLHSKPMLLSVGQRYVHIPLPAIPYLLYEEGLAEMPPTPAGYNTLVLFRTYLRTLDEKWRGLPQEVECPAKKLAEAMQPATSLDDFRRQTRPIPKQLIKDVCITHAPALGWDGAYSVSLSGSDAEHWIYPAAERPKFISPTLLRRVEKFPPHLWEATFLPSHLGMPEALMFLRLRKVPLAPNPGDTPRDLDYAQDIPL